MNEREEFAKLVLMRHGESEWNNAAVNLFCGWVNVDLSEKGVEEAKEAATVLRDREIRFTECFTSRLTRSSSPCSFST